MSILQRAEFNNKETVRQILSIPQKSFRYWSIGFVELNV